MILLCSMADVLSMTLQEGRVYLCALEIMDGVPCKEGTYCTAPLCLLHVNAAGQLKPISIQLGQKPGKDNPIFLPSDSWVDWTAAKIYYMSSHAQVRSLTGGVSMYIGQSIYTCQYMPERGVCNITSVLITPPGSATCFTLW